MKVSSILKFLRGSSLNEKIESLKDLNKRIEDNVRKRKTLSEEYMLYTQQREANKHLNSEEITKSIETRYRNFEKDYNGRLTAAISEFNSLEKERDSLLKSKEISSLMKQIEDDKVRTEEEKTIFKSLKKAAQFKVIPVDQYLNFVQEKQGGKVKYADNIILNEDGELLLMKRSMWEDQFQGEWVIPGGHVDPGEDFKEAALRELGEESGIWLDDTNLVGTYEDKNCIIHYFSMCINRHDHEILLDFKETVDYVWVPLKDINDYKMVFNMKDNIKKIMNIEDEYKYAVNIVKAIKDGIITEEMIKAMPAKNKVAQVMREFESGELTSNGKKVTDRDQALAIAMSEAGLSKSTGDSTIKTNAPQESEFISKLKTVLSSKGIFNEYQNKYKLKDVPYYPKGLDLENCDLIHLDEDKAIYEIGGDWQEPKYLTFCLGSRDESDMLQVSEVSSKEPDIMSKKELNESIKKLNFVNDTTIQKSIYEYELDHLQEEHDIRSAAIQTIEKSLGENGIKDLPQQKENVGFLKNIIDGLSGLIKSFKNGDITEDELIKSRRGIYEDNGKNRKLGRVGLTYGIRDLNEETQEEDHKSKFEESFKKFHEELFKLMGDKYFPVLEQAAKTTNSKYIALAEQKGDNNVLLRVSDHPANPYSKNPKSKIFKEIDVLYNEDTDRMIRQAAIAMDLDYDFSKNCAVKQFSKGDEVFTMRGVEYVKNTVKDVDHKFETITLDDGTVHNYNPQRVIRVDRPDDEMQKLIAEETEKVRNQLATQTLSKENFEALQNNGKYYGPENRDLLRENGVRTRFISNAGFISANDEVVHQVANILAENGIKISELKKEIPEAIQKAIDAGILDKDFLKTVGTNE